MFDFLKAEKMLSEKEQKIRLDFMIENNNNFKNLTYFDHIKLCKRGKSWIGLFLGDVFYLFEKPIRCVK